MKTKRKRTGPKPPPPADERAWLTTAEIADQMDVQEQTVCRWITVGVKVVRSDRIQFVRLTATKIGRYRVARGDWDRFREAMRTAGGAYEPPPTEAEQRRRADAEAEAAELALRT